MKQNRLLLLKQWKDCSLPSIFRKNNYNLFHGIQMLKKLKLRFYPETVCYPKFRYLIDGLLPERELLVAHRTIGIMFIQRMKRHLLAEHQQGGVPTAQETFNSAKILSSTNTDTIYYSRAIIYFSF